MEDEIRTMLDEEIKASISDLNNMQPGSKEKSAAVDDLTKLYKLKIEETKNEMDYADKFEAREHENLIRKEQTTEQGKDRLIRICTTAGEIVVPLIFYGIWMNKGFKFEETGTYTSATFRNLFQKFKPTKR